MSPQAPHPQRVRFRRGDIVDLNSLPSAAADADLPKEAARVPHRPLRTLGRRIRGWLGAAFALTATLAFAAALAAYGIGASGLGTEKLRQAAERALERVAGRDMATAIGATRITLDSSNLMELEILGVGLKAVGQPRQFATAGSVRFGIQLMPLLSGRLVLSSASLSGASIDAGALGSAQDGDWLAGMRRKDGLLDPDRLVPAVFAALRGTFVALERDFSGRLELSDVTVSLPVGNATYQLAIAEAEAIASDPGALTLSAEGTLDGRDWSVSGAAERDVASGRITLLDLDVTAPQPDRDDLPADAGTTLGSLRAELKGAQGDGRTPSRLEVNARTQDTVLDLKNGRGILAGSAEVVAGVEEGAGAVRIAHLRLEDGSSSFALSGSLRPRGAGAEGEPAYALELAGSDLRLASAGSAEPPFAFDAKLQGSFAPGSRRLRAESLRLASGPATVDASLAVLPAKGLSSGVEVSVAASALPVGGAKRLWPPFAGRSAWNWVQQHLHGGTVEEARIDYRMAPGRIGSGVAPTGDELAGTLTVTGALLDTTGEIPPVADADGMVSFHGTDVDVALSAGRMRTPGGRTLSTDRATLALRAVNRAPLIGRLDADLEGDAAAAAELAAAKPIDALSRVPFAASDLSGAVKARVEADVPFQRDVRRETLDFAVAVDFTGVALAKPLDGQTLREGNGTLTVSPQKAVIEAQGELNGVPAKLSFVEPLREGGAVRSRRVELTLDDKARNALAPGLSALLSGPAVLQVDASAPKRQVRADLSKAKLSAPWVGWSKGAGIPATATFSMTRVGDDTEISDLEVSGKTFRLAGSASFDGAGLRSARFPSVALNRDDAFALSVRRAGTGFEVNVSGASYDARALVKAALGQTEDKSAAASGGRGGTAPGLSLRASVASVAGFGNENLKDVTVRYRSGGAGSRSLAIDGLTAAGGAVAISDDTQGGQRRMALKTADGGSLLRFLNIYGNMRGGAVEAALAGPAEGAMKGRLSARAFSLVNEPRLGSLVSSRGNGGTRSLQDAVKRNIDTSRVVFDRASADLTKGSRSLSIANGVLRGAAIGSTFQGTLYDERGRMDMTGTFMPAYGLNRLFGELPLIGLILGNGNDRGLIGVTFKLEGEAKSPAVTVNPLSAIAPGIFRQIFEFD